VAAAFEEANRFIQSDPRKAAEIFLSMENVKLVADYVERMIKDPEVSFDPAPANVMKIYLFMNRIGSLKTKPGAWTELFYPEVHHLQGS
jgi:NitT/TauT family transport system substrate-binding protein